MERKYALGTMEGEMRQSSISGVVWVLKRAKICSPSPFAGWPGMAGVGRRDLLGKSAREAAMHDVPAGGGERGNAI
jgi:hypothetical protein